MMDPRQTHSLDQNTITPHPHPLFEDEVENEEDRISRSVDWESKELLPEGKLKSTSFLILLTASMGGIQLVFSIIYSHGVAHLRSLGLSRSQIAITFISGPLTGIFVQPLFGIWSDRCRLSSGQRRPFIAFGGAALIVSLLCLAWTKTILSMVFSVSSLWGERKSSDPHDRAMATMASALTFCVFFAIQPAQGGVRALIVDNCPTHQQKHANAWVSRISGMVNVFGYLSAIVDLSQYLSFLGDTQFKILSILASFFLGCTILLTCRYIVEKDPFRDLVMKSDDESLGSFGSVRNRAFEQIGNTYHEVVNLPPQITRVCLIQFFAWIGWYPYLLYVTTYVGEIYVAESGITVKNGPETSYDSILENASRVGSLALLFSSIVSLLSAVFLPWFINTGYSEATLTNQNKAPSEYFKSANTPILSMRGLWLFSHGLFALCVFSTLFVSTVVGSVVIFGLIGLAWTIASLIPFTLLSIEISQRSQDTFNSVNCISRNYDREKVPPGTVFGMHNIAICIPQIIISVASSIVWKSQPDVSQNDPRSTGWVLRAGGIAALVALILTTRIREPTPDVYHETATEEIDLERLGLSEQQLPNLEGHRPGSFAR